MIRYVTLDQRSQEGQAISLTLKIKVKPNVVINPPQGPATSEYSVYIYVYDQNFVYLLS